MEEKPRPIPYPVRMPEDLREKLEEAAKSGARSLHAEIISRLQASFAQFELSERDSDLLEGEMGATVKSMANTIQHLVLLSKRLGPVKSLQPTHFGKMSVKMGPPPEPVDLPKADISTVPATLIDTPMPKPPGRRVTRRR